MRNGDNMCLDIESVKAEFPAYASEGTFNPDIFFDYESMNQSENYLPFVKENEMHGVGGLNPGFYSRSDNFQLIIRSSSDDQASLEEQIAQIPLFYSQFHHVIIQ